MPATGAAVTAVHAPGTELAHYAGGQVEESRARMIMTPDDAKQLDQQLRAVPRAVLIEDTDYGVIPGTNGDKVVLKPGEEKLLQWCGPGFTNDRQETDRDDDGQKEGVTYRCTITKGLPDGRTVPVATCEAYAGYDEDKFFQTQEQAQFKAEAKERMWAAKDRRPANPNKWKYLTGFRAPWNTIIRMAQKRSLVGATIDATAAAGLFAQEDPAVPEADDVRTQTAPDPDDWPEGATAAPAADAEPWIKGALKHAAAFQSEAARAQLVRDAAAAARDGH